MSTFKVAKCNFKGFEFFCVNQHHYAYTSALIPKSLQRPLLISVAKVKATNMSFIVRKELAEVS